MMLNADILSQTTSSRAQYLKKASLGRSGANGHARKQRDNPISLTHFQASAIAFHSKCLHSINS